MHDAISRAVREKRNLLETEALRLFSDYGMPVPEFQLVKTKAEAEKKSKQIGFPVVLKIVSPDIIHKSDVGGVKVNLITAEQIEKAYDEIMGNIGEGVQVEGMLVRKYVPQGLECIVGMTKDPQFGPALMFGLGGIFVELLKDVSFRVLPLTRQDVELMIKETKGYSLLKGTRGESKKDIPALVDFLLKTQRLIEENPAIQEIDINPLAVFEKGVWILDARVIL